MIGLQADAAGHDEVQAPVNRVHPRDHFGADPRNLGNQLLALERSELDGTAAHFHGALAFRVRNGAVASIIEQGLHRQSPAVRRQHLMHVGNAVDRVLVRLVIIERHLHAGGRLRQRLGRAGQEDFEAAGDLQRLPFLRGDHGRRRHPKRAAQAIVAGEAKGQDGSHPERNLDEAGLNADGRQRQAAEKSFRLLLAPFASLARFRYRSRDGRGNRFHRQPTRRGKISHSESFSHVCVQRRGRGRRQFHRGLALRTFSSLTGMLIRGVKLGATRWTNHADRHGDSCLRWSKRQLMSRYRVQATQ